MGGKFIGSRSYLGENPGKNAAEEEESGTAPGAGDPGKGEALRDVEEEQPLKILPLTHWKKELIRVRDLRLSYQPGEEAGSGLSAGRRDRGSALSWNRDSALH